MPLVDSGCQTDDLLPLLGKDNFCEVELSPSAHAYAGRSNRQLSFSRAAWMSKRVKKCLYLLLTLVLFGVLGMVYVGYYFPESALQIRCVV